MDVRYRANRMLAERDASDRATSELLGIVLAAGDDVAADVALIADAIDRGQIAQTALVLDQLCGLTELPAAAADVLAALFELTRRAALGPPPVEIRCAADVALIAQRELGGRTRECVLVIACDATNLVLRTVIVSVGSADAAPFPVREILAAVLRCDGRTFAVAHNHPGGVPEPGDADVAATERIAAAAHAVGLRFLGHVVVGARDRTSYAAVPNSRFKTD